MHAAVVSAFDRPPRYQEFPDPVAQGTDEAVVEVVAAGLHPRVRSQADGSHYTSTAELPLIPGIDGVVRGPDGRLRYTVLDDTTLGTLAERTILRRGRSIVLPEDVDAVAVAAAMNPAMSSWVALRRRIDFRRGRSVLVLGATGNAGRMAVQVARKLGASRVIGAGRNPDALEALRPLGADEVFTLGRLAGAADVDVVLDYLWGEPAATAMVDMISTRKERSDPVHWIQIGSMAGLTSPVPSAALRAARLQIVGSGIGSVDGREWLEELPQLVDAVTEGEFDVRAKAVPLKDVEQVWAAEADDRIVLLP
ncbi:zinc-binding alcohol dehydrogenase family protein [Streptomyces sp. SID2888]|uniref:quinone oxidoreductase family protein n=1 Tax=Streptomyces sp. SID2888 TaxID=2690256 RepID=UPI001368CCDF|nr:zinc-binding alcohol dehydrogenase family protein [Streptomyces sp. SID2888]MYV44874.1 zinc-binding alcohol dehydrogenase family protein [Streptomyces sp. SID2888]